MINLHDPRQAEQPYNEADQNSCKRQPSDFFIDPVDAQSAED